MQLFIYDHCPYCTKARMIFGLKRVPVTITPLLNDDEATPVGLIGRKMVPILQRDDGHCIPESMDIVHYIDQRDGQPVLTGPKDDPRLQGWLQASGEYRSLLCMPRWVQAPLAEYTTEGARAYFRQKKEASIGSFEAALAASDALIAEANRHLQELELLIVEPQAVHGTWSEDDIHLFAQLRCLSIVRGLYYPPKVEAYRQAMSAASGVPLHDAIAI